MPFSYKLITDTICSFLSVSNHSDFDIVFLLLPYAYVTMQLPVLLDAIQSGSKKMLSVSNDLLNEIENLYGENNG